MKCISNSLARWMVLTACALVAPAQGDVMVATFIGNGSGTLGGVLFQEKPLKFIATFDTDVDTSPLPYLWRFNTLSTEFAVTQNGQTTTCQINSPWVAQFGVNASSSTAFLGQYESTDLLGENFSSNQAIHNYEPNTPFVRSGAGIQGYMSLVSLPTTAGNLIVTSVAWDSFTYMAPVPGPAVGVPWVAMGVIHRRRRVR